MTHFTPTSTPKTFSSIASLRSAHRDLLKHYRQSDLTPELLTQVQTFLLRGRETGASIDVEDDRWVAQSLLDYWISILYRTGAEPPDATLVEFDPSLAPELDNGLCPYLGLAAFQEKDHELFYGRQRLLDKLIDRLRENRFLAVIGSSGSGKSSIVLGGLLPSLKAGKLPESQRWRYYSPMVPGSHPLENLAGVLCPENREKETWVAQQIEEFEIDPGHLLKLLDASSDRPGVLIIDQFEETFTLCLGNPIRQAFIDNLLTVIQSPKSRHVAILTMRTDFESRVALHCELQQAFLGGQVRVTAMDARELREAIEKPAESVGLKFEEGLIDRLMEDVLGEPAALPLLQFTLLKLWENRERNRVTWETYKRLGGGRLALSRSADEFYQGLIPEDQLAAKRILLKMVKPTEGLEVTSSRIPRQLLYPKGDDHTVIDRVLEKLIQARLVQLTPGERSDDDQVEVAHEALVRNWSRLVEWVEDKRVDLRTRWRLKSAAQQWQERSKDPSVLWWGRLLQDALRYEDLSAIERNFVKCSQEAERENREKEEEEQQKLRQAEWEQKEAKKKLTRTRQVLSVAFAALLGTSLFFIFRQLHQKSTQFDLLLRSEKLNNLVTILPEERLGIAIQIAGESQTKLSKIPDRLQQNLTSSFWKYIPSFKGFSGRVMSIYYSADDRSIVTISDYGTVNLWKSDGEFVETLEDYNYPVTTVVFSPSGNFIATSRTDGTVNLWKSDGTLYKTLKEHTASVTSVVFSQDEQSIVTTSIDGNIKFYKITEQDSSITLLDGPKLQVTSVVLSQDGKSIATTSIDGTAKLWKTNTTSGQGKILNKSKARVTNVVFSPQGNWIATGSADGTIDLWKSDGTFEKTLEGHQALVTSIVFSPDEQWIATGSADGRAMLWKTHESSNIPLEAPFDGHQGWVTEVIFSPKETWDYDVNYHQSQRFIATVNVDGEVRIWTLNGNLYGKISQSYEKKKLTSFTSVSFTPDGQGINTTTRGGETQTWDLHGKLIEGSPETQKLEKFLELACTQMGDRLETPKNQIAREARKTCKKYL